MILHAIPQKVLGRVIRTDVIKSLNSQTEDFFKSGYPVLGNISFTSEGNNSVHWTHCYASSIFSEPTSTYMDLTPTVCQV